MSLDRRHAFEARAADARLAVDAKIEAKQTQLKQQLLELRAKQAEAAERGLPPLLMSSARWGQEQLLEVEQLLQSNTFSKAKVADLRRQCRVAIGPPPRGMQAYIASLRLMVDHPPKPRPPWLGLVCRQRAFFGQCVFKFVDDDDEHVYVRPTFIRQSTFVVGFVKLAKLGARGLQAVFDEAFEAHLAEWSHVFRIECSTFCFSDEGGFHDSWRLSVLVDTVVVAGGCVVSDAEWKRIDEVRTWFAEDAGIDDVPEGEPLEAEAADELGEATASAKLPWLLEYFPGESAKVLDEHPTRATSREHVEDDESASAIGGAEILSAEDVITMLHERRYVLAHAATEVPDFKVQVRGGHWTAAHVGEPYDSFRSFAMKGDASRLCALFGMTATATFSIKLYTEVGAERLAQLWCHRLQWYLDLWMSHGKADDFHFDDAVLSTYEEPEVGLGHLEASVSLQRRLATIRAIRPR